MELQSLAVASDPVDRVNSCDVEEALKMRALLSYYLLRSVMPNDLRSMPTHTQARDDPWPGTAEMLSQLAHGLDVDLPDLRFQILYQTYHCLFEQGF